MALFDSTLKYTLIYVFAISDGNHEGILKVGETTLLDSTNPMLAPNSKELNQSAKHRIDSYTKTAGIQYQLLYTESTIFIDTKTKTLSSFNDKQVHLVLERSGVKKKRDEHFGTEWFYTDLQTIQNAIQAIKDGRTSLTPNQVSQGQNPIIFRPEQREAIDKTTLRFKHGSRMLWNAKMRFGKTLSALQVVKELELTRTLILTHRPAVDKGWFEDFAKIFYDQPTYHYGSKSNGDSLDYMESSASLGVMKYIYFASMQDLRGSNKVGGKFNKNHLVFSTPWDLIIVDEAHEGTQTKLGENVMQKLTKPDTKVLQLSGTPYNLLNDFSDDEVYTWDYIMEQTAKAQWDASHFGDPNPYAGLPSMNIYTYDLGKLMSLTHDHDIAFNFTEFMRTKADGTFAHADDVLHFLNLLTKEDKDSCYPFANQAYRDNFKHTLWMVPGVKEAAAMSAMLKQHPVFGNFEIVNVAGEGDEEIDTRDALAEVKNAIAKNEYTITLSCGRLTTGVSVPEWTAVLMISGSFSTAASSYMQTIFRVQTPWEHDGMRKEQCYVFDFAPDRTLKVIAETAKVSTKAGKTTSDDRQRLGQFLNFCPIIAYDGSRMQEKMTADHLFTQLKKIYVERVVSSGFEDNSLYNDDLLKMDTLQLEEFKELGRIIGSTKAQPKTGDIDINDQGLSDEEYERKEQLEKKKRKGQLTDEEKAQLEAFNKAKRNRAEAISILRGISIRMPLLIYGAELDEAEDITINNFILKIDDNSWNEFMPKGVTKLVFSNFRKYYDQDIFIEAGRRIRALAKAADEMGVEERIERITGIFDNFRNPDKETVLTPWRVVNMHMGDCLGGYNFYDETYSQRIDEPRYIEQGQVTTDVFNPNTHILEINSKTGLYPLYVAYSVYRSKVKNSLFAVETVEDQQRIWDEVLRDNIFVLCKTKMAQSITKRTLRGFRNVKTNTHAFDDLINQITNKQTELIEKINKGKLFNNFKNMKFNAIVGNPPYQEKGGSGGTNDAPIYQHFCSIASSIPNNYISLIIPSRWFAAGRDSLLGEFRKYMLNCGHIKKLKTFISGSDVFPHVELKGGVCYYLEDQSYSGTCNYTLLRNGVAQNKNMKLNQFDILIREPILASIVEKVEEKRKCYNIKAVNDIVSNDTPFGIPSNPKASAKNSFTLFPIKTKDYDVALYIIEKGQRKIEYIPTSAITKNQQDIDKIKVFIPEAGGSGTDSLVLGKPLISVENSVCTQSYLYAPFPNINEATCFVKYLSTKFFRILVSSIKITQHAQNRVYRFVPLQDFTENSDIDWSKSVEDIDRQLYKKYDLSAEEIAFIERMIKPMSATSADEEDVPQPKKRGRKKATQVINVQGDLNIIQAENYIENIEKVDTIKT